MTGIAKCLGCKMSGCQNVLICMQWHNVWVAYCLAGKMSGCQNVRVPKYLVVIMYGCQKRGCLKVLVSKCLVPKCRKIRQAIAQTALLSDGRFTYKNVCICWARTGYGIISFMADVCFILGWFSPFSSGKFSEVA